MDEWRLGATPAPPLDFSPHGFDERLFDNTDHWTEPQTTSGMSDSAYDSGTNIDRIHYRRHIFLINDKDSDFPCGSTELHRRYLCHCPTLVDDFSVACAARNTAIFYLDRLRNLHGLPTLQHTRRYSFNTNDEDDDFYFPNFADMDAITDESYDESDYSVDRGDTTEWEDQEESLMSQMWDETRRNHPSVITRINSTDDDDQSTVPHWPSPNGSSTTASITASEELARTLACDELAEEWASLCEVSNSELSHYTDYELGATPPPTTRRTWQEVASTLATPLPPLTTGPSTERGYNNHSPPANRPDPTALNFLQLREAYRAYGNNAVTPELRESTEWLSFASAASLSLHYTIGRSANPQRTQAAAARPTTRIELRSPNDGSARYTLNAPTDAENEARRGELQTFLNFRHFCLQRGLRDTNDALATTPPPQIQPTTMVTRISATDDRETIARFLAPHTGRQDSDDRFRDFLPPTEATDFAVFTSTTERDNNGLPDATDSTNNLINTAATPPPPLATQDAPVAGPSNAYSSYWSSQEEDAIADPPLPLAPDYVRSIYHRRDTDHWRRRSEDIVGPITQCRPPIGRILDSAPLVGENHHPFDFSPIQYYDFPVASTRERRLDNTLIPPAVPTLRSPSRRVRLEMNPFNNRFFYNTPPPITLRQHQEEAALGLPNGPVRSNALATRLTLPSAEYVRALPPHTLTLGINMTRPWPVRRSRLGRGPNTCRIRAPRLTCHPEDTSTNFKDDPAPPGNTQRSLDFFGSPIRLAIDFASAAANEAMNIVRGRRTPGFLRFNNDTERRITIEERIAYRVAILRQHHTETPEAPLTPATAIALLADNSQQTSHDIAAAAEQVFTSRMALVNYNGEEDPRVEQNAANAIFQAQRTIEAYNMDRNRRREAFNLLTPTAQETVNNAAAASQTFAWATSFATTRREPKVEARPIYESAIAANAAEALLARLAHTANNAEETNEPGKNDEPDNTTSD